MCNVNEWSGDWGPADGQIASGHRSSSIRNKMSGTWASAKEAKFSFWIHILLGHGQASGWSLTLQRAPQGK